MLKCALKSLDIADIVREAIFRQLILRDATNFIVFANFIAFIDLPYLRS